MVGETDAQSGKDPGAPSVLGRGGPVLSAWVAGECDRVLGRELTGEEERVQTDLVTKAKER